jgi:uncharacterized tellurite resistance protein B-like protein
MAMNEQDKIQYLANVLRIAFADKWISAREGAALEEIRKGIDAKKAQLTAAQKAVESSSYSFIKVGSFADQVRNLEDMLFVSMTDTDLNETESKLVKEFCSLIGIYQDQLDKVIADTSRRCDSATHNVTCPSCSTPVPTQSRFCPSCGQPLASPEVATVQVGFDIPNEGYAIEFCESTAGGFASAVEMAKATGAMETAIKNKKTWYLVKFPASQFVDMVSLASSLAGMRNRRVYLDGKELAWDEVFGFIWCSSRRETAYRPIEYCFGKDENRINPWGCKQSRMEWTEWAQWFSYGRWQKVGLVRSSYVFVFDKERIRHELSTNLYRFRYCPHMHTRLVEAVLKHLPAQVDVTSSEDWKYSQVYEALPGAIKITERLGSDDYSYTNEYYSDGVRPKGYAILADILTEAFAECGYTQMKATTLLSK